MQDVPYAFYSRYVPWKHRSPTSSCQQECRGAAMISFALYPGAYQPSGHINVSRATEFYIKYHLYYISDFFVFIGPGDFELYLWDDRQSSSTYESFSKEVVGESNPVSVLVPPGVVHGYKAITPSGSFSINLPDKLYAGRDKKEKIDEIRHENISTSKFIID